MKMLSRLSAFGLGVVAVGLFAAALLLANTTMDTDEPDSHPGDCQTSREQAITWLQQSDDGKSLGRALTAARFGLEWQESAPGEGNASGGYLGVSHEQNLKAWFGPDGVTVRPTLPEAERQEAWSMALAKSDGRGGVT